MLCLGKSGASFTQLPNIMSAYFVTQGYIQKPDLNTLLQHCGSKPNTFRSAQNVISNSCSRHDHRCKSEFGERSYVARGLKLHMFQIARQSNQNWNFQRRHSARDYSGLELKVKLVQNRAKMQKFRNAATVQSKSMFYAQTWVNAD